MRTALFASLFLLAYFLVFYQVTANPGRIKRILSDSGVYQQVPSVVYDNVLKSESKHGQDIPLKSPVVRQTALATFTPDFVQTNVENSIDGVYGWLAGKTSQPQFNIDLKGAKGRFARSLSNNIGKLPKCSLSQQAKIKAENFDAFSSPCVPPGVDIAAIKKKILGTAAKSDELVKQDKISPITIKDKDGKPVFDNYKEIPRAYQLSVKLPYLFGVFCLILAAGLVLASQTKRDGFRKLGKVLAVAGVFVAVLPIGLSYAINKLLQTVPDSEAYKQLLLPVAHELIKANSQVYITTGVAYILIAVVIFIILKEMPVKLPSKAGKAS